MEEENGDEDSDIGDKIILGVTEPIQIKHKTFLAKIDTGAFSSSICKTVAEKLELGPPIGTVNVRSSTGRSRRKMVRAAVTLKGREIESDFSVADRRHMSFDVLIGRKLLKKGGFIVDPSKTVTKTK